MTFIALVAAVAAPVVLGDPIQEARAHALEQEIRCVQCQNEPIAQSTADIAVDMRALVRERVAAGDSDNEIRAFFRERYGDFVLFRPPFDARTWVLWLGPFFLALLGVFAMRTAWLQAGSSEADALEPEEGDR
ncbi:MAG: cytochrome c-type biogenesis protein CcmH [Hyphomonadaceae bacterium]|nr:cytochrome c-type biogenesis protein CcmH [Hyphomonadaceae bacterium]